MNHDEKQMIDGLFTRLGDAEKTAPPRDAEADRFIQDRVASQPGAPYYMAQTIIVQEQALEAAQARIHELESQGQRSSGGGGLLGSLFGGGSSQRQPASSQYGRPMGAPAGYAPSAAQRDEPAGSPWNSRGSVPSAGGGRSRGGGGGFLAGAAQTAVGVAGGMMLGSMLGGMFAGDAAQAEEAAAEPDAGAEDMAADDMGGGMDDGSGFGDFEL